MIMRNLFSLYFLIIFCYACGQNIDSKFIDLVTGDFSRTSYFIPVKATINDNAISCLIENDDLFYYFHETNNWNEAEYKQQIRQTINKQGIELNLSDMDKIKFGFLPIANQNYNIDIERRKGVDFIIKKYFNKRVIKQGINEGEKYYLIKILFESQIASRFDDETGFLIIDKAE